VLCLDGHRYLYAFLTAPNAVAFALGMVVGAVVFALCLSIRRR